MNRREAIAALAAGLPATATVTRAQVKPDDVIVIECDLSITQDVANRIKARVQDVWPGHRVLVLSDGLHLKIAQTEPR